MARAFRVLSIGLTMSPVLMVTFGAIVSIYSSKGVCYKLTTVCVHGKEESCHPVQQSGSLRLSNKIYQTVDTDILSVNQLVSTGI